MSMPALAETPRQQQWYLDTLQIPAAQQESTGQGVLVAVVDSGVDGDNPDFGGRVMPGLNLVQLGQDARSDTDGHGTAMAGVIAGGGVGDAPLGIAPGAEILPIKVGEGNDFTLAEGIKYAADHGAKVINVSSAAPGVAPTDMKQALEDAFRHDAVVVAGAGNTTMAQNSVGVPANYPGVIAATGTSRSGSFWSGSVAGPEAVLAAPAESIISVASRQINDATFSTGSGTSYSTAIVSGTAALIRAKYPSMDAANVVNRLIKTADDKGTVGRDPQYGFGVVDPVKALTAGMASVGRNPLVEAAGSASGAATGVASSRVAGAARGSGGGVLVAVVLVVVAVALVGVVIGLVLWRRRARRPVNWSGTGDSAVGPGLLREAPRNGTVGRSPGPDEGVGGR
jgi:type VII secretion-associated serine protease mycosin